VLLRFAYLAVTNAFAALRLLPMSDRDKDVEILTLRHQIRVLQRQLGTARATLEPADRAILAALPTPTPPSAATFTAGRTSGHHLALAPRPDQKPPRDSKQAQTARPPTHRGLDPPTGTAPGARESHLELPENPRGELAALGIKLAASTVWQILKKGVALVEWSFGWFRGLFHLSGRFGSLWCW
jgi:hypothetical protein